MRHPLLVVRHAPPRPPLGRQRMAEGARGHAERREDVFAGQLLVLLPGRLLEDQLHHQEPDVGVAVARPRSALHHHALVGRRGPAGHDIAERRRVRGVEGESLVRPVDPRSMRQQQPQRDGLGRGERARGDLPRLEVGIHVTIEIQHAALDEPQRQDGGQYLGRGRGLEHRLGRHRPRRARLEHAVRLGPGDGVAVDDRHRHARHLVERHPILQAGRLLRRVVLGREEPERRLEVRCDEAALDRPCVGSRGLLRCRRQPRCHGHEDERCHDRLSGSSLHASPPSTAVSQR